MYFEDFTLIGTQLIMVYMDNKVLLQMEIIRPGIIHKYLSAGYYVHQVHKLQIGQIMY